MRAVIQRVKKASVETEGKTIGRIGRGVVIFLGVGVGDSIEDALYLARKIAELRIFNDEEGRMNLSLKDVGGQALVVSQFTLYGDCRKGRRPSFTDAASPEEAERLYEEFCSQMRKMNFKVETGKFQAMMVVKIENDGPVTFILESKA